MDTPASNRAAGRPTRMDRTANRGARTLAAVLQVTAAGCLAVSLMASVMPPAAAQDGVASESAPASARRVEGVVGDGVADDTAAIQAAVDSGGALRFSRGIYRLTEPIVVDLDRVGFTSIEGGGVARFVMEGAGPAFRFLGTHDGTASPATVQDNVWDHQRSPMVDAIEIVGRHAEASGIEATGTMQLTVTRLVVRDALHAIRLVRRNRNVLISECHLYDNRGVGVFLDGVNLHQINIANCHISYNDGGGVVAKGSEIRNLQIGTCDLEGNMGGEGSDPSANVWLDSTGSSVGEVSIVGCTIQHTHDAPDSANIRFNGRSTRRPFTEELRHGNLTIADNVLSDVRVNLDIRNARGVTISGNTMWKGYDANVLLDACAQVVMTGNVLDRNPRYHYGDGPEAKLGVTVTDCDGLVISGNQLCGAVDHEAAVVLRRCRRVNVTGNNILDYGRCGLFLDEVADSRVTDNIVRDDQNAEAGNAIQMRNVTGSRVTDNLLGTP